MIEPVVRSVDLPPGMLGPAPTSFEVRCFVVAGPDGVVLVDTATPGSSSSISATLAGLGLDFSDVTDVVLTHHHFDHTGGLSEAVDRAPRANLWAGADDLLEISKSGGHEVLPVGDGQAIADLRVLATPGHTPGHISLFHQDAGCLFVGDLVGSANGMPTFGPPAFSADPAANERSLRRVLDLAPRRVLFSHGRELPGGARAVRDWLDGTRASSDVRTR